MIRIKIQHVILVGLAVMSVLVFLLKGPAPAKPIIHGRVIARQEVFGYGGPCTYVTLETRSKDLLAAKVQANVGIGMEICVQGQKLVTCDGAR